MVRYISASAAATIAAASKPTETLATNTTALGLPIPPDRDVARPVSNLGNTCYMNAVLQALAHAPELCLAMDCKPHRMNCPIAMENRKRQPNASSPTSSPPGDDTNNTNSNSNSSNNNSNNNVATAMMAENERRRKPARKLRRSSRKSPTNGVSANNTTAADGGSPGTAAAAAAAADDATYTYCALCEMELHLEEVHTPVLKDNAVAPSPFVHGFIDHVAPHFKLGQQEDSHEFLRLLIEAMQHSCTNARPPKEEIAAVVDIDDSAMLKEMEDMDIPAIGNDANPATATPATPPEQQQPNNKSGTSEEDTEYPFKLFSGTVESCVKCSSCQASSSTWDPIEDVGLEVTSPGPSSSSATATTSSSRATPPTSNNEALADVTSAFKRFACVEDLDSYKCEQCGNEGRATKQSRLHAIPPILTLHLKRFRYGSDARAPSQMASVGASNRRATTKSGSAKIEGQIQFKQIFDLKPYLTDALQATRKSMFCRLFAVVVHAGKNSHSGHYYAYVRNIQRNEWWKMDDARVISVNQEEVMNAEAYMLFYRVVDHPFALLLKEEANKLKKEREAVVAKLAAEVAVVEEEKNKTVDSNTAGPEAEKENVPDPAATRSSHPKTATELPEAASGVAPKVVIGAAGAATKATKEEAGKEEAGGTSSKSVSSNATTKVTSNARGGGNSSTANANANHSSNATNSSSRKRERAPAGYADGKAWARANTRLSSSQYKSFRSAEEYVNENVQFTPDFFKIITEEGSKDNAKINHCPIRHITGDDVVGGKRPLTAGLKKVIHRMAMRYGAETGESFFQSAVVAAAAESTTAADAPATQANLLDQFTAAGGGATAKDEMVTS